MMLKKLKHALLASEIIAWAVVWRVADWVERVAETISETADAKMHKRIQKILALRD